ncbi:MAG: SpoIVB peptidase [Clostridia bacterium]|nr:SpoIVB peptidase [Clostridia bacterium]
MTKISIKSILFKIFIAIFCLLSLGSAIVNPIELSNTPTELCSVQVAYGLPSFKDVIRSLFRKNEPEQVAKKEKVYVYLGGYPLGFTLSCSGAIVVANSNESAKDLAEGDIIIKINNEYVNGAEKILEILNKSEYSGKEVDVTYIRNGKHQKTKIKPIFDELRKIYKLGIWVRDNAAGVGTLTYIRKDNLRFGALGHPVCDIDTGSLLPVDDGNIYKCNIVGYKRGVKGDAGELKGLFLRSGRVLGSLDANNKFGVYGAFNKDILNFYETECVEVASANEVKSGKAVIRCTIDGSVPKDYEIEIVRTYFQSEKDNKSMFIRVTDKELIEKTGGIVQGMSGSPIIQNGKLVGAVTHVFISDPTKGYGVYADYMIDN